jgi:hypothetical protein
MRASLFMLLASCGGFIDHQAATSTLKILQGANSVAEREADVALAREALPAGIFQLAAFAKAYPDEPAFAEMHAEAVCQYAAGFVFDDWEDASMNARDTAPITARLQLDLRECVAANTPANTTNRKRWIATADALSIAIDPVHNLGKLPATIATLEQTIAVAPGAHAADSELLLGTLRAATSPFFHGPDGSAEFEAAKRTLGEGALMVDVMFARSVAVARKDRALFEARLHHVLDADPERWPERRLANELARQKARRYLAAEALLLP